MDADKPPALPLVLHKPTGLIFVISQEETQSDDRLRVYAVLVGHALDEFGNDRKVGKLAADKIGRQAIVMYLGFKLIGQKGLYGAGMEDPS